VGISQYVHFSDQYDQYVISILETQISCPNYTRSISITNHCIGYASEVWAPTYKIQLEFLEKIQKRYCRLTGNKSYSGNCQALSLTTVENYLKHKDLRYMQKILSNNTCLKFKSRRFSSLTQASTNLTESKWSVCTK
jgi:hypothetical protein